MSFNLPPGVNESMIPGNDEESLEWECLIDDIIEVMDTHGLTAAEVRPPLLGCLNGLALCLKAYEQRQYREAADAAERALDER